MRVDALVGEVADTLCLYKYELADSLWLFKSGYYKTAYTLWLYKYQLADSLWLLWDS